MLEERLAGEGNGFKHPLRNAFLGGYDAFEGDRRSWF